jgi:hypothetical protein
MEPEVDRIIELMKSPRTREEEEEDWNAVEKTSLTDKRNVMEVCKRTGTKASLYAGSDIVFSDFDNYP